MSKTTYRDGRPAAVICRERGWTAGTCLEGDEGYGPTVIRITAVGERNILARGLTDKGKPVKWWEGSWGLDCRDWHEVPDPTVHSNSKEA